MQTIPLTCGMPVLSHPLQTWSWSEAERTNRKSKLPESPDQHVDSRRTFLHHVLHRFSPQDKWVLAGWQAQTWSWRKLWWNWMWLPLRNSRANEGERQLTRQNKVSPISTLWIKPVETQPAGTSYFHNQKTPWWWGSSGLNNSLQKKETSAH